MYIFTLIILLICMLNAGLDETQPGTKIGGRNINILQIYIYISDMQMIPDRKQRGTKEPLDEGERGE